LSRNRVNTVCHLPELEALTGKVW